VAGAGDLRITNTGMVIEVVDMQNILTEEWFER
jgi:hypothetical protein